MVQSSAVDVAAPTDGAVSYTVNGGPCDLSGHSSEWAAGEVAAVAAMVWSYHDGDTAAELRARLLRTADGDGVSPSRVTGYGVVQPLEALTRRLDPRADGVPDVARPDPEEVRRADPPPEQEDVLRSTRRDAVWWGLLGGGALVAALVLRPVLNRRRSG